MYNYDYIGQLTMMYNVKKFGTIQIKDIRKNNDYAIRLVKCFFVKKEKNSFKCR